MNVLRPGCSNRSTRITWWPQPERPYLQGGRRKYGAGRPLEAGAWWTSSHALDWFISKDQCFRRLRQSLGNSVRILQLSHDISKEDEEFWPRWMVFHTLRSCNPCRLLWYLIDGKLVGQWLNTPSTLLLLFCNRLLDESDPTTARNFGTRRIAYGSALRGHRWLNQTRTDMFKKQALWELAVQYALNSVTSCSVVLIRDELS